MKLVRKVRDYLLDDEFKMILLNNKINISNYEKIEYLDDDKVIVKYEKGKISIKGEDITVSKLLNNEILITGSIKEIEMKSWKIK